MNNKSRIGLLVITATLNLGAVGCNGFTFPENYGNVNDNGNVECTTHNYEIIETLEPTCTDTGLTIEKCSVCGDLKTSRLPKINHNYVLDERLSISPTCFDYGKEVKVCSECSNKIERDIEPLDHDYQSIHSVESATCTKTGIEIQECSRCHENREVETQALGHSKRLICDVKTPKNDFAQVRVYECQRCEEKSLSFNVSEVTRDSKERLCFFDDGGASFWGRSIGNNVELDERGDLVYEPQETLNIFDETIHGDSFDFNFTLTQEQLDALGDTCVLYCDAQPANYLGGYDFWAADPNVEEFIQGFYIEGKHKGKPIQDYRYILYVDGEPVNFNPNMRSPVTADPNEPSCGGFGKCIREEFAVPYVFHLHEGDNSFSLRMAGGYKSTFYNFTFKPYEPPVNPMDADGMNSLGNFSANEYSSGTDGVVLTSSSIVSGIKFSTVYNVGEVGNASNNWTQNPPVVEEDASEGDNVVYTVKANKAVKNAVLVMTINYPAYSWDPANLPSLSTIAGDGAKGYVWNEAASTWSASPVRYKLFVNDVEIELYPTMNGYKEPVMGKNIIVQVKLPCSFDLNEGYNTIELQNYGGYNAIIASFEIRAYSDAVITNIHAHNFVNGKCTCGLQAIEFELKDQINAAKKYANGDKLDRTANAAANAAKFSITLDKDFVGYIYAKGGVDASPNWTYGWHIGKNGGNRAVELPDEKTNTILKVDNKQLTILDGTYEELSDGVVDGVRNNTTLDNVGYIKMAAVTLYAGRTYEITLEGADSFAPCLWGIALIGTFAEAIQ